MPTVYAAESLNNEIGLPLTVCGLEPDTEVLITEMGMRGLGQIAELCAIARPELALVTSIGPEHLELVGSVDDVARANAEAIDALPSRRHRGRPGRRARARAAGSSARTSRSCASTATTSRSTGHEAEFALGGSGACASTVPFTQRHFAENMLAALVAYDALGLPLERAQEGAAAIRLSRWRGEEIELPGGGFVVNDAYNANPTSMRAALLDLASARGRAAPRRRARRDGRARRARRTATTATIGDLVAETVDVLVAVGEHARLYMTPGVAEMHCGRRTRTALDADGIRDVSGRATRAREGVARRRSGRRPRPDRETRRGMVRVLIAGLVAMVIAVVIGPTFIDWLRRRSVGQQIRAEGPAGHHVKQGTPTMGGLLILFAALAPFLVLSVYTLPGLTVMGTTLGCGLIGFLDDYLKVRRRRSLGLPGRWKMLLLVGGHRRAWRSRSTTSPASTRRSTSRSSTGTSTCS